MNEINWYLDEHKHTHAMWEEVVGPSTSLIHAPHQPPWSSHTHTRSYAFDQPRHSNRQTSTQFSQTLYRRRHAAIDPAHCICEYGPSNRMELKWKMHGCCATLFPLPSLYTLTLAVDFALLCALNFYMCVRVLVCVCGIFFFPVMPNPMWRVSALKGLNQNCMDAARIVHTRLTRVSMMRKTKKRKKKKQKQINNNNKNVLLVNKRWE